jgi:hypothetical protein
VDVLAVGSSVERLGFFGGDAGLAWTLTGDQGLTLWQLEHPVAGVGEAPGEEPSCPRLLHLEDARLALSSLLPPVGSHATSALAQVHYVVNCHYDTRAEALALLAGDYDGTLALLHLGVGGAACVASLAGGHGATVRDWAPLEEDAGGTLATCAEDGLLCLWC